MMNTAKIVTRNLRHLMKIHNYNMAELARRSGITARGIKFILDGERVPNVDTTHSLARAFNLDGWHLLNPQLPVELISDTSISKLIADFAKASPESKQFISDVADREARRTAK